MKQRPLRLESVWAFAVGFGVTLTLLLAFQSLMLTPPPNDNDPPRQRQQARSPDGQQAQQQGFAFYFPQVRFHWLEEEEQRLGWNLPPAKESLSPKEWPEERNVLEPAQPLPRSGCLAQHLAASETVIRATRTVQDRGFHRMRVQEDGRRWMVYLMFQHNYPMFLQSLRGLLYGGFSQRLVVLDNSPNCTPSHDPLVLRHARVLRTPTQLTFAQMHQVIAMDAQSQGMPFYFWTHSDGAVVMSNLTGKAQDKSKRFAPQMLSAFDEAVAEIEAEGKDWGVIFLAKEDRFAAFRTEAVMEVHTDVGLPLEGCTCDWYTRMEKAGHVCSHQEDRLAERGQFLFESYRVLKLPWEKDHERTMEILQKYDRKTNRITSTWWRNDDIIGAQAKVLHDLQEQMAKQYFRERHPNLTFVGCKPKAKPVDPPTTTSTTEDTVAAVGIVDVPTYREVHGQDTTFVTTSWREADVQEQKYEEEDEETVVQTIEEDVGDNNFEKAEEVVENIEEETEEGAREEEEGLEPLLFLNEEDPVVDAVGIPITDEEQHTFLEEA
ncbi:hypothetical protein QOT17_012644 [Balamuthia mandrillaris]